ncbi:MAG: hypothetical protein K0M70_13615 [Arenimonas sp.]|uniref:hypothetical protein n=1 Tax=Arenimonas sp. TaxID=1872635 RepID=UPI0025B7B5BF|nr:hypothetical protein [Arenimonas sp.]MBW8368883.1 hypothetical protein [Arenimonas sp.]
MQQSLKSIAAGVVSGVLTYAASIYALGFTNAFVMPHGFPVVFWDAAVVFGLGAMLVALLIHLLALRVFGASVMLAFTVFATTAVVALAATDLLMHGGKALAAWSIGAFLASVAHSRLRSNNSFKPNSLRGSA